MASFFRFICPRGLGGGGHALTNLARLSACCCTSPPFPRKGCSAYRSPSPHSRKPTLGDRSFVCVACVLFPFLPVRSIYPFVLTRCFWFDSFLIIRAGHLPVQQPFLPQISLTAFDFIWALTGFGLGMASLSQCVFGSTTPFPFYLLNVPEWTHSQCS